MPLPPSSAPMADIANNLHAPPNAAGGRRTPPNSTTMPMEQRVTPLPKKKANIKIATLNINRASAPRRKLTHIDKWSNINSTMKDNRIAILAIQETHLDKEQLDNISRCFGKNLDIFNSSDPENPCGMAGVAFVVNKSLMAPRNVRTHVLHHGHALMLKISWSDDEEISLVNIYAPNDRRLHPAFWEEIDEKRRWKCLPKPDFVLGNFNITEDPIDRSPPQENEKLVIDALWNIRHTWEIQDQWCHDNPGARCFTHKHKNNGQYEYARLNWIYTARMHTCKLLEWDAGLSAIPMDHWMVEVNYAPKDSLLIGNGRWTWPLSALNHEPLIEKIISQGINIQTKIERVYNTPCEERTTNIQAIWNDFKSKIQKTTKKMYGKENYKIHAKIQKLKDNIKSKLNSKEIDNSDQRRGEVAQLTNELAHLHKKTTRI